MTAIPTTSTKARFLAGSALPLGAVAALTVGAALARYAVEVVDNLSPATSVDTLVALAVTLVGVTVAAWAGLHLLVATFCLVGAACGQRWRAGERLVVAHGPSFVRRGLAAALGVSLGLGGLAAASASSGPLDHPEGSTAATGTAARTIAGNSGMELTELDPDLLYPRVTTASLPSQPDIWFRTAVSPTAAPASAVPSSQNDASHVSSRSQQNEARDEGGSTRQGDRSNGNESSGDDELPSDALLDLGWRPTPDLTLVTDTDRGSDEGSDAGEGDGDDDRPALDEPSSTESDHPASHDGEPQSRDDADSQDDAPHDGESQSGDDADSQDDAPSGAVDRQDEARPKQYVVATGDTLWSITDRLLGGATDTQIAAAWPDLFDANRDVVGADPDLIHPGQELVVPAAIKELS